MQWAKTNEKSFFRFLFYELQSILYSKFIKKLFNFEYKNDYWSYWSPTKRKISSCFPHWVLKRLLTKKTCIKKWKQCHFRWTFCGLFYGEVGNFSGGQTYMFHKDLLQDYDPSGMSCLKIQHNKIIFFKSAKFLADLEGKYILTSLFFYYNFMGKVP